jgi:hypothetical protein
MDRKDNYKLEIAAFNKNPQNAGWVIFIGVVGCSALHPCKGALTTPIQKKLPTLFMWIYFS